MSNVSGIFGTLISSLKSSGATPSAIASEVASLGGALNTISSQVNPKLNQLASLCNNPAAYNNSAPGIITLIEETPGLPPGVLPLLETLRGSVSPLIVAETIQAIEQEIAAAPGTGLASLI